MIVPRQNHDVKSLYQRTTIHKYDSTHWSLPQDDWDGDDLRWFSRWRRRLFRTYRSPLDRSQPARNSLVAVNVLFYSYQVINTIQWIIQKYPAYWPRQAFPIIFDALMGSTSTGPLTRDFIYTSALARIQPHRYLTAGFLHGGILHLVLNMDALRRIPNWVETGLGSGLFLTTFLVSVVAGNLGHTYISPDGMAGNVACLGASGGICGLYGLMYVALVKMGNDRASSQVIRGMGRTLLYGLLISKISNAAHIAGFLSGIASGILLAPSYSKSYSARRKWSLEVDMHPRDYRVAMGFGVEPSRRGKIPLALIWLGALVYCIINPRLRVAPQLILKGLLKPGSLASFLA